MGEQVIAGGELFMLNFLKGIAIFFTTITISISGLFIHSKPVVKSVLLPTPTVITSISPTPKKLVPSLGNQIITNENNNQYNSVTSTPTPSSDLKQKTESTPTPTSPKEVITTTSPIIIPTSTPIPTPTPSPTPTLSYNDLHCPKIIKIEDSLGNVAFANSSNSNSLQAMYSQSTVQDITITISATDPQNLPLSYQYGSDAYAGPVGSLNLTDQQWIKDNHMTYHVGVLSGVTTTTHRTWHFTYRVDNQDGYNCSAGTGDVGGYFTYTVTP